MSIDKSHKRVICLIFGENTESIQYFVYIILTQTIYSFILLNKTKNKHKKSNISVNNQLVKSMYAQFSVHKKAKIISLHIVMQ